MAGKINVNSGGTFKVVWGGGYRAQIVLRSVMDVALRVITRVRADVIVALDTVIAARDHASDD